MSIGDARTVGSYSSGGGSHLRSSASYSAPLLPPIPRAGTLCSIGFPRLDSRGSSSFGPRLSTVKRHRMCGVESGSCSQSSIPSRFRWALNPQRSRRLSAVVMWRCCGRSLPRSRLRLASLQRSSGSRAFAPANFGSICRSAQVDSPGMRRSAAPYGASSRWPRTPVAVPPTSSVMSRITGAPAARAPACTAWTGFLSTGALAPPHGRPLIASR